MRLYIRPIAPNALKIRLFMAERGIEIETVDVETLSPEEYGRVSALRTVPVLETDGSSTVRSAAGSTLRSARAAANRCANRCQTPIFSREPKCPRIQRFSAQRN
jgi:hypothetical protein